MHLNKENWSWSCSLVMFLGCVPRYLDVFPDLCSVGWNQLVTLEIREKNSDKQIVSLKHGNKKVLRKKL